MTTPSIDTEIALIHRDLKAVREIMDKLLLKFEEVTNAHDKRIRSLEEERIRMRVMLLPLSIILSAALSFGTQNWLNTIATKDAYTNVKINK